MCIIVASSMDLITLINRFKQCNKYPVSHKNTWYAMNNGQHIHSSKISSSMISKTIKILFHIITHDMLMNKHATHSYM